jgi:alginate O-acetyltransferase complex protein AlgI
MLFNSYHFILAFLPITAAGYFLVCRGPYARYSQLWLVAASLLFYSAWNPIYLPLILGSIAFNFVVSRAIYDGRDVRHRSKRLLMLGLIANLALLGYFKYADFFTANVNATLGVQLPMLHVALPLGISFFTFTQIAFLVDTYQHRASRPSLINYALFVSYFPHLLAGPILHHREMMPQFEDARNRRINFDNISHGVFLFAIGLTKKVVLADSFADIADSGFNRPDKWAMADSWLIVLAYGLQLYFDFSGYTDMALGVARMFNIRLPINFNSPYRATSIQEFWHRWHITLSRFMREYVYIPLGGSRTGRIMVARNVLITFALGGLWHGAGWTFVVWGILHGGALVTQRMWREFAPPLPRWLGWFLTFVFVNVAWVFFRAPTVHDALTLVEGLVGRHGLTPPLASPFEIMLVAVGLLVVLTGSNSNVLAEKHRLMWRTVALTAILLSAGFLSLGETSPFIYFNF